ncbi:MAG TPA: hypothetical protein VFO97_03060, partial [Desertimonas sp.]|nr:hypothetical protein [Desertimonas sp.]
MAAVRCLGKCRGDGQRRDAEGHPDLDDGSGSQAEDCSVQRVGVVHADVAVKLDRVAGGIGNRL